jgi:prepilin-type N-terminal cleavage/methylation domain-containing protein
MMVTTKQEGFTLIEFLVAIAILAVAIVTVFGIYSYCMVEIRRAKLRTVATNCGQQMMEMICSTPHDILNYHDLNTASIPPSSNPIRADFLTWKSVLQTSFPTWVIGTISVVHEPYSNVVTVTIRYDSYGREATSTLSMKIAKSSP